MTTVRCPRCHDEVTLPPRAGKKTHVRCPMCLEDYLLDEALRNSPPLLEVIGGELEPAPYAAAPGAGYAAMNDMDAGLTPAGVGDDGLSFAPTSDAGVFGTMGPAAGEAAVSPAGGVRAATRPKRKKGPLGTIVGVVFGGALGVGLAPLAIWWIAGTDPFELAPKVPAALRFVLPAKLRAEVEGTSVAKGNGQTGNVTRPTPANTNNNPQPQPMPDPGNVASNDPGTPESMPEDPLATNLTPPANTTPDENPEPSEPVKPATNTSEEPPPNARLAIDLLAAMGTAREAADNYDAVDASDKEAKKKVAVELYEAACQVGPLTRGMDWQNAGLASAKDELQTFLSGHTNKVGMIGTLALRRLNDAASPPGILLAGKVTDLAAAGKQFAVTVVVGKAMQEVVIITPTNPQDIVNVDDTVLVLGSIERDPSQVKGYTGPAETLVVSGFLQKVE